MSYFRLRQGFSRTFARAEHISVDNGQVAVEQGGKTKIVKTRAKLDPQQSAFVVALIPGTEFNVDEATD